MLNHIPPSRADHLAYFNPADLDHPVGLNLLGKVALDERHLIASGIVSAFRSICPDSWPRMEYIFYNALAACSTVRTPRLLGISRLLIDTSYRAWVVRQIRDPFIR